MATRSPERTFLSGLVRANEPIAADIALALATALDASPDDIGLHYWDTLLTVLGDAIQSTIDMQMKDWKPKSDWGKRFLAEVKANAENEGRSAGISAGLSQGISQGISQGRAASILELLDVRGLALDPPLRERITTCTDVERLSLWLRRAATASSVDEIFAAEPPATSPAPAGAAPMPAAAPPPTSPGS